MKTNTMVMMIVSFGCILQSIAILGWVLLGWFDAPSWAKWSLVGLFGSSLLLVFAYAARTLGWQGLVVSCVGLALTSIAIDQTLGFLMFPGLVKDVDLFSYLHVVTMLKITGLSFLAHAALALVASLAQKLVVASRDVVR
jgi:hypothetical protein